MYGKFSTFTKELVGLVKMESCAEEMTELLGVCCSTSSIVFSVTPHEVSKMLHQLILKWDWVLSQH